jgi:hypothetical protein
LILALDLVLEQSNFLLEHGVFLFNCTTIWSCYCGLGIAKASHSLRLAEGSSSILLTVRHHVLSTTGSHIGVWCRLGSCGNIFAFATTHVQRPSALSTSVDLR